MDEKIRTKDNVKGLHSVMAILERDMKWMKRSGEERKEKKVGKWQK